MLFKLFVLLISIPLQATVFQKQPVNQQIKESDGIIIGHFLRSKSIKLENGGIATQMIFKMKKEVGMQSDLFGMDEIIIHYPGGTIEGQTVKVEGVPNFVSGEHVVLMVKNIHDRYWGMNLGFGTFRVINYGNEKLIVNSIFPDDRNVGQMKLEEFEKEVKAIKGSSMKIVMSQLYPSKPGSIEQNRLPASGIEGKNRAIASNTEEEENNQGQGINIMWLLLLLAAMGGLFRLIRQKVAK